MASLFDRMDRFFGAERAEGRHPVFVRFFLSDAQNQIAALRKVLETRPLYASVAVSIVFYGWRALLVLGVSVASCVLLEYLIVKYLLRKPSNLRIRKVLASLKH